MEFLAPAKINLTLRVLHRREDGFHAIETLMAPLSIFDTLEIELRAQGGLEFSCSDPSIPDDDTNLAVRAARLFCESYGFEPRLRIHLKKEIPHGAGLGGGSSDAATVLMALNRLHETELPLDELSVTAAQIGSDVPFFLHHSAAWCRGRGEQVEPCEWPGIPLVLIKPPFGVPTPWAYRRWSEAREIPGVPYAPQLAAWGDVVNDLERPVFEKNLQLAALKCWLLAQPESHAAMMSGSGSTMFAVTRDRIAAQSLAERAAAEFGPMFWYGVCETV